MAIDGKKFLKVSKTHQFSIRVHAMERIHEFAGDPITLKDAFRHFCLGHQLRYEDMRERGYRPAYYKRLKKGVRSWYFQLNSMEPNLIAVIIDGDEPGELEWITTYGKRKQAPYLMKEV